MLKNKWSCTKLIGGGGAQGGVQKSYTRTDPTFKIILQDYVNLEIKKKSGLSLNPNIHHSKVPSSDQILSEKTCLALGHKMADDTAFYLSSRNADILLLPALILPYISPLTCWLDFYQIRKGSIPLRVFPVVFLGYKHTRGSISSWARLFGFILGLDC